MRAKRSLEAGEPDKARFQSQPKPRQRILVVDDEPDLRRLNTALLTDSGYAVDAVEDGAIAWETLQRNRYDLLVTDHNMPKVTGVELLQKLHVAALELPVIMVTATLPQDELDRHPWLQIQAILLKPYTIAEFLQAVKNVMHPAVNHYKKSVPVPNWQNQPATAAWRL